MKDIYFKKSKNLKNRMCVIFILTLIMALCVGSHTNAMSIENDGNSTIKLNNPKLVMEDDGQEYMSYDIIEFGSYPQSDPTGSSKDPIKWRVLDIDDEKVLLWADSILDYKVFDSVNKSGKCWDTCELRSWLMGDFADTAFSIDEKKAISYVDHFVNYPESDICQVVRDSIFLPDMEELHLYNYKDEQSGYIKNNRQILYWRYATAYAHLVQIKAGESPDNLDGYWLRTSGQQKGIYQYVKQDKYDSFNDGSVWCNSAIDTSKYILGVCPMVYTSKSYLEQTLQYKENRVVRPYTEYDPPYADTVWVDDDVKSPRYETLNDDEHSVVYDIVEMGSYPQSDINGVEKEPIKWRVMNATETKLVLMADSILDYSPYNKSADRSGIYWGSSDIRKWLNDYFYNYAFSDSEKEVILETSHENGSKRSDSVYTGRTDDKLMLPSYDDICDWMQEDKDTLSDKEKTAVIWRYPTAYSYEQYKKNADSDDNGLSYWLGTSSDQDGYYMHVVEEELEGNIRAVYAHINSCTANLGICPVMVVDRTDSGIYKKTGKIEVSVIDEIKLPFAEGENIGDGDGQSGENESGKIKSDNDNKEADSGTETDTGNNTGTGTGGDTREDEGGLSTGDVGKDSGDSNNGVQENKDSGNKSFGTGEEAETTNNGVREEIVSSVENTSTKKEIKNAVLGEIAEQKYTGEALKPELSLRYDGIVLVKDVDYTVSFINNINSGIAYANVTGCGQYSGTASFAFAIQPRVIDGLNTILKGKDGKIYKAIYTGSAIRPKTSFRLPLEGETTKRLSPQEGKDYTVSYANNRKIGVATITYRFYGNYTGIVTKEFQIVPDNVTKFKAKYKKSKAVLTWMKVKGAAGYEILRSLNKDGKYVRIARIGKKLKYTDKKTKGKKYYYKIRAFGKNADVRYYGGAVVSRAK